VFGTGGTDRIGHRHDRLARFERIAVDGQLQPEWSAVEQHVIEIHGLAEDDRVVATLKVHEVDLRPEIVPLSHYPGIVEREGQFVGATEGHTNVVVEAPLLSQLDRGCPGHRHRQQHDRDEQRSPDKLKMLVPATLHSYPHQSMNTPTRKTRRDRSSLAPQVLSCRRFNRDYTNFSTNL